VELNTLNLLKVNIAFIHLEKLIWEN